MTGKVYPYLNRLLVTIFHITPNDFIRTPELPEKCGCKIKFLCWLQETNSLLSGNFMPKVLVFPL